jgi:Uma2 family endonuclease
MNIYQEIPKYTYADYALWQGDWELIQGYPYAMSPSAKMGHQWVGTNIVANFTIALRKEKTTCGCKLLYETDWIISEETVVRPDISIVCQPINPNDFIRAAPVLIVEIASGSTRLKDRNTKFMLYQACGVKYYLLADPDKQQIEYFQLVNQQYQLQTNLTSFELHSHCLLNVSLQDVFE